MSRTPKVWFTSDNHFGHSRIIQYCNRPFSSVDQMNAAMKERWNDTVAPDDIVYHIGDISMHIPDGPLDKLLRSLHGKKHLFKGNHDHHISNKVLRENFLTVREHGLVPLEEQMFFMSHYPARSWANSFHGSIMLHGHVHGRQDDSADQNVVDVGVDSWDFTPVSVPQILALLRKRKDKKAFIMEGRMAM